MVTPATRAAAALRVREQEAPHRLQFVENKAGTYVHVVATGGDGPRDVAPTLLPPGASKSAHDGEAVLRWLLGEVATVCGWTVRRNRGGLDEGGRFTAHFDDALLCSRCHAAFVAAGGEQAAALIFEDNPPGDDVDEDGPAGQGARRNPEIPERSTHSGSRCEQTGGSS